MKDQQTNAMVNGTKLPPPHQREIPPMPDHLQQQAKTFFETYVARDHELDSTKRDLDYARSQIAQLNIENEVLRSQITTLESRAVTLLAERDEAVAFRVNRETIMLSVQPVLASVLQLLEQGSVQTNEQHDK